MKLKERNILQARPTNNEDQTSENFTQRKK